MNDNQEVRYCTNCLKAFVKNARAINCFFKLNKWYCRDCEQEYKKNNTEQVSEEN